VRKTSSNPGQASRGAAAALLLAGCVEFSPFETDLAASERDQTKKNLASLAAQTPSAEFGFAVVSDSHQYADQLSEIVERVNARTDIAFLAHLGDMTDVGLREEYRATLTALQKLRIPFVTVIGNHDGISNGKKLYREMFGPYDYTFTYGAVGFICFNSNPLEFPRTPDLAWLAAAASGLPAGIERVVALTHQPLEGVDSVLKENGVSLLLNGHHHRWSLSREGEFLSVGMDDVISGRWQVVHLLAGGAVELEACSSAGCEKVSP
jgi:predicted phosphodiesterase